MKKYFCRICGHSLLQDPLLRYENMPKSAQDLPDKIGLKRDKGVALDVYQCSGCGLVQLINEPVSYYKNVIRAAAFSDDMRAFRIKQFAEIIDKYSLRNKKVIEIGCGRGEYLSLIKQSGVDAYGIENLNTSVEFCVKNGLKVSAGFIEQEDQAVVGGPFAAFIMLNYFEHLPNPNLILAGIKHNLAEDGIGLIEVPNFDMILRNKLFSEFIPDHLSYFTEDTLETALKINGFDILESKEIWHDYIISMIVRKRKKVELADFCLHQSKLKNALSDYISKFQKVAIWGAGHQAFALISLMELSKQVRYVVDSAPFKQGKYTPASHLPIVDPETLNLDPPDAIIIIAGGYSDEVARTIKQKHSLIKNVAVLRSHGLEII
ncbi:MAG: methyltransferase domain-containing protein [Candidatus Margulisiibacteriota bacterium]